MEIRTQRLLLRSWCADDADALVRNVNHREIWRNVGDSIPHPYTRADAEAFLASRAAHSEEIQFAIVSSGELAGSIGIYRRTGINLFTGELGYWLGPDHWGRGIATEAARSVAEHGFTAANLERVEARVFAWNPASCRVLEKAGFQREGVKRRAVFKDGEFVDEILYARLRGE